MNRKSILSFGLFLLLSLNVSDSFPFYGKDTDADRIIGRWVTEKKDLIVEVYKCQDQFKARIIWFNDKDDLTRPMNVRGDDNNPDPALRSRKLLGLDVLKMLKYNKKTSCWEDGLIYDADSGKEWSSCASMTPSGSLRVKGYWKFKFLSKSVDFFRLAK